MDKRRVASTLGFLVFTMPIVLFSAVVIGIGARSVVAGVVAFFLVPVVLLVTMTGLSLWMEVVDRVQDWISERLNR